MTTDELNLTDENPIRRAPLFPPHSSFNHSVEIRHSSLAIFAPPHSIAFSMLFRNALAAWPVISKADLESAKIDLDRLTVRAPVDGQVMQLKVHLGEYAPTGVLSQPLILLGGVEPMHVRVNVDENDAWRVRSSAQAIGFLRGNNQIKTPLHFVCFEPYVVPKVSLTGDSTERVDTRVLQIIYSFERGNLPI